jgi:GNAT superfamily N-acetyltransferase
MTASPPIQSFADSAVDATLDRELRTLLSTCFTKPQDHVFKVRRYFNEPPSRRWVIREESGPLAAHLAVHDKRLLLADGRSFRIGGIAEVCVHPAYQGRGYAKLLLAAARDWMIREGFLFSVLNGDPSYYSSSAYRPADNLYQESKDASGVTRRVKSTSALVATLSSLAWPEDEVCIPGPNF